MKLTPQREVFAGEIAKGKTQADAYRVAFPSSLKWADKTLWSKASALAADGKVRARVAELTARGMRNLDLSIERVLLERKRLAFYDPRKLLDAHGNPLPIHELDDDTAAAVAAIELATVTTSRGATTRSKTTVRTTTSKVKLADKNASLSALERHLGMYASEDNGGRKAGVINILINLGG